MTALAAWAPLLLALPFVLVVGGAFLRFAVVMAILRRAIGGQGALPPPSVAALLALLLAAVVTAPVATRAWDAAQAASARKADPLATANAALEPVRAFFVQHTPAKERQSFFELQRQLRPPAERAAVRDADLIVLAPAFASAELKAAFQVGFLLFLPFLVLDLLAAMTLTSLGMNGVAPETVALPFKLLLFVVADGWHLLFRGLVLGYT